MWLWCAAHGGWPVSASGSATPRMNAHAPQPSPEASRDASRPRLDLGKLRGIKFKDLVIRFMFGGTLSVFAAWIAHVTSLRFGGIFAAFPVVLLASLTIIGKREGAEPAAEDAQGGVAGACAFLVSASPLAFMLTRVPGGAALVAALAGWGVLALLLYYAGVAVGWLRTPGEQPDHRTRDAGSATEVGDRSGAAGMEHARE